MLQRFQSNTATLQYGNDRQSRLMSKNDSLNTGQRSSPTVHQQSSYAIDRGLKCCQVKLATSLSISMDHCTKTCRHSVVLSKSHHSSFCSLPSARLTIGSLESMMRQLGPPSPTATGQNLSI